MLKLTPFIKFFKTLATIFLGLIFVFIFFETILFAFGKLENQTRKVQNNFSKTDEFVILALGESTTVPIYDFNMKDYSWPAILEKLLNEIILEQEVKVINEGIESIDSNKILSDLERNIEKYDPDLVISMMGINDFFGEIAYEAAADIEADSLLSKSRTYKLIKFLIVNIKDNNQSKVKEELDCDSEESCLYLASIQEQNNFPETKLTIKFLEEALKYNPNNVDTMIQLGYQYMYSYNLNKDDDTNKAVAWFEKDNDANKAIAWFERALENDPENSEVYNGLAQSLVNLFSHEEKWVEKIKRNVDKIQENIEEYEIKDVNLFLTLATYEVLYEKRYLKNENRLFYLTKALEVDPENPMVSFELARYHTQYNNFKEAESSYLEGLKNNTDNTQRVMALIELANLYLKTDRQTLAEETFKKAIDIGGIYVKNYQKLYEILQSNNIKLIAVGYPMRSTQPLELMFSDSEVLVVSNELNFKKAVEKEGYDQIFVDRFAGDFGHCSEKGNLLLAENVKLAILENWEKISGEN